MKQTTFDDDLNVSIKAIANSFDWETKKFTGSVKYEFCKKTNDPTNGSCQIQFENVEMSLNVTNDLDLPLVRLEPMMSYKYHNGETTSKQTGEWSIKVKRTFFGDDDIYEYNINQNTDITQGEGKENWDYIMTEILDKDGKRNYAPFTPYYFKSNVLN